MSVRCDLSWKFGSEALSQNKFDFSFKWTRPLVHWWFSYRWDRFLTRFRSISQRFWYQFLMKHKRWNFFPRFTKTYFHSRTVPNLFLFPQITWFTFCTILNEFFQIPILKISDSSTLVKFNMTAVIIMFPTFVNAVKNMLTRVLLVWVLIVGTIRLSSPIVFKAGIVSLTTLNPRSTQYDPFLKGQASVMFTLLLKKAFEFCKTFFDLARWHMLYCLSSRIRFGLLSASILAWTCEHSFLKTDSVFHSIPYKQSSDITEKLKSHEAVE